MEGPPSTSAALRQHLLRATFLLGVAARRTVDLVGTPYRALAAANRRHWNDPSPTRRGRIEARLTRMNSRLATMEQTIVLTERRHHSQQGMGAGGRASDDETVLPIIEALHDPDPGVRRAAAAAAGRERLSAAVFSLILLLDDEAAETRQEAAAAIERITGQRLNLDDASSPPERRRVIDELKKWWKEQRFARLAREVESVIEA